MFNKLRKSTQPASTPPAEPARREDIPYWATLKSIYLASLAKTNSKKAQRRLRHQAKRANGAVDDPQTPHVRRYPVEIIGKLPPDGVPRPPSFIYSAPIKRFHIPQPRMHSYPDDGFGARPTRSFPETASARYSRNSLFSNADDPFSVRPSQLFLGNTPARYSSRNSRQSRSRYSRSSAVHTQPTLEDSSLAQPPPINLHPNRESACSMDSASVYSQESAPRHSVSHCDRTSTFRGNPSDSELIHTRSSFILAPVPEHAKHPRNRNRPPSDVPTTPIASHYSQEALLVDRSTPTRRAVSTASEETLVHRSSSYSEASLYSQASIIPIRSSFHSRLNRLSISTVGTIRQGANGQDIDVSQNYHGKEISQNGDTDSEDDSDSTYDDDDSDSISSVSSVSSAETAFYSCDGGIEDRNNTFDAERNVVRKARMDVLAVAEALRDTQDERTLMEINFREDVVTGLARVFAEAAAHGKAKQRHLAPLKCKSYYSFMSLDSDHYNMPGAFGPASGGRGRSSSTLI